MDRFSEKASQRVRSPQSDQLPREATFSPDGYLTAFMTVGPLITTLLFCIFNLREVAGFVASSRVTVTSGNDGRKSFPYAPGIPDRRRNLSLLETIAKR
jgi:hypothetical protein